MVGAALEVGGMTRDGRAHARAQDIWDAADGGRVVQNGKRSGQARLDVYRQDQGDLSTQP